MDWAQAPAPRGRQAAPFSKGQPKADPKRPGRKAGADYGVKAYRPAPEPSQEPDEIIEVPLPQVCPDCNGQVANDLDTPVVQQFQTEIPRRPIFVLSNFIFIV